MKTCKIDGCKRKIYGKGFCSMHWTRWYRYGDPLFVSPHPRPRLLPTGEAAFRNLLRNYKNRAKRLGYEWNLSEHDFRFFTESNCHYCGEPPSRAVSGEYNGSYIFNGIDRIDNGKGYSWDNCVTACSTCNLKKKAMSYKEFRDWILRVAANIPSQPPIKEQWECT